MLMLLCVHVTRVLFLVLAGNSALTMGFYWSHTLLFLVACSYALLLMYITGSLFLVMEIRPTASLRKVGGSESESLRCSREEVSGLVGVVECTAMSRPLE